MNCGLPAVIMMVRLGGIKNNQPDEVAGDHDGRNREDEVKNEQLRFTAGLVLLGKKIHFYPVVAAEVTRLTIYDMRFTQCAWIAARLVNRKSNIVNISEPPHVGCYM